MKRMICLLLLVFFDNSYCQTEESRDLAITIQSASYHPKKFSSTDLTLQPNESKGLRLHDIYITLLLTTSDPNIIVDFNNFSLVENELKLRLRTNNVECRDLESVPKLNLKEFVREDPFLKYSQEGIKNLDYYYPVPITLKTAVFNKYSISQQERFYLYSVCNNKKKKRNRFTLNFSVNPENSGEFSLYYKDQLIKTFILKRGEPLGF